MRDESAEELQRILSPAKLSLAAKKGRSITLYGVRVLCLMGYIVFLALVYVSSEALGLAIAVALNWWLGWPDLLCISIQDCYELLF